MLKDGWMGSQAEMMRLIVIFTILQMCLKQGHILTSSVFHFSYKLLNLFLMSRIEHND